MPPVSLCAVLTLPSQTPSMLPPLNPRPTLLYQVPQRSCCPPSLLTVRRPARCCCVCSQRGADTTGKAALPGCCT